MTESKTPLSHRISESAGSILPGEKIEALARLAWLDMKKNAASTLTLEGKPGHRYKGNLTQAQNRVAGAERRKLSTGDRDVLDNAVRQFLRYSGNAKCIKREPRDQIEWWVSETWSSAVAVPVVTASKLPNGQENWFEKKIRPEEITGGYDPFPVTVTKPATSTPEPQATPSPSFSDAEPTDSVKPSPVDQRWRIELMRTLKRGTSTSTLQQVMTMAATWDEPFSSDTYAQLYNSNTLEPSAMLLTLRDSGLIDSRPTGGRGGGSEYTTNESQKLAVQSILDEYPDAVLPTWKLEDTRNALLDALFIRNFQSTEELSRKLCMNRAKMVSALGKMVEEGMVERRRPHREAEWRLATTDSTPTRPMTKDERMAPATTVKPAAAPAAPTPVRATPTPPAGIVPQSTMDIAKSIEGLVERRVQAALVDHEEKIKSKDRAIAELQAKVKELEDWKTQFRTFLNG